MNKSIELAHLHPQPFGYSEIERRGPDQSAFGGADRRTPHPDRGSRNESLEAVRYLTITLQDILEAIQTDWPTDRPQTQKLQERLGFGAFAVTRVRNGALRRMAESTLIHPAEGAQP